jgi:hypothetical protein
MMRDLYPYSGRMLSLAEIARETGLTVPCLRRRLKRGESPERAFAPGKRQGGPTEIAIGTRFTRLVVVAKGETRRTREVIYMCRCDCADERIARHIAEEMKRVDRLPEDDKLRVRRNAEEHYTRKYAPRPYSGRQLVKGRVHSCGCLKVTHSATIEKFGAAAYGNIGMRIAIYAERLAEKKLAAEPNAKTEPAAAE